VTPVLLAGSPLPDDDVAAVLCGALRLLLSIAVPLLLLLLLIGRKAGAKGVRQREQQRCMARDNASLVRARNSMVCDERGYSDARCSIRNWRGGQTVSAFGFRSSVFALVIFFHRVRTALAVFLPAVFRDRGYDDDLHNLTGCCCVSRPGGAGGVPYCCCARPSDATGHARPCLVVRLQTPPLHPTQRLFYTPQNNSMLQQTTS